MLILSARKEKGEQEMPINIQPDAIYKTSELAEILEVKETTIFKHIREGKIPAKKFLGKRYHVKGFDIIALMESK